MKTENKKGRLSPLTVASAVVEFVVSEFGEDADSPAALEGIFLAMQMVGGPRYAAEVIGYCSVKSA